MVTRLFVGVLTRDTLGVKTSGNTNNERKDRNKKLFVSLSEIVFD